MPLTVSLSCHKKREGRHVVGKTKKEERNLLSRLVQTFTPFSKAHEREGARATRKKEDHLAIHKATNTSGFPKAPEPGPTERTAALAPHVSDPRRVRPVPSLSGARGSLL